MGKQREVHINHTICPTGGACLHSCTLHTQRRRHRQPNSIPSHTLLRRRRACQPNPLPSGCLSLTPLTSNAEPDLIPRYNGDSNRRSTGKLRMHDINVDSHSADADSDSDCDCDVGRIRFRSNGHITFVHLQSSKWRYQFSLQELQVDPYTSTHTHAHTHIQTNIYACVPA